MPARFTVPLNCKDDDSKAAFIASQLHLIRSEQGVLDQYAALRKSCSQVVWRKALVLYMKLYDSQS